MLNEINWSKVKFHKQNLNGHKVGLGDFLFHKDMGYVKLEKLILGEGLDAKPTWECLVMDKNFIKDQMNRPGDDNKAIL